MIKNYFIALVMVLVTARTAAQTLQPKKIMLLDTSGREAWVYKPFIEQARMGGMTITYIPFDTFADMPEPTKLLDSCDGIFFMMGLDFLIGIQEKSPLSQKILALFNACITKKNMLIGLFFPNFNAQQNPGGIVNKLPTIFLPLVHRASLLSQDYKATTEHFLAAANAFLERPLTSRPCNYHTTLQAPRPGLPCFNPTIERIVHQESTSLIPLPKVTAGDTGPYATIIEKMLPFGIYWFNPMYQNHIFISSNTLASFTSIKEDFHLCPVNRKLRETMEHHITMMITQLSSLLDTRSIKPHAAPTPLHYKKQPIPSTQPKEKTAWMELVIFEEPEKPLSHDDASKRTQQQNQLITYILQASLDTLWISITPNILYSPIAREKHREKKVLSAIALFTKALQTQAQKRKARIPNLCVGFEITNNIYAPHLPAHPAVDLYGTTYPDLPHPLSHDFWHHEIVTSLKHFVLQWQSPTISHGIKLAGIVIDLEMYCRRKSGTFIETMGFDAPTFARYAAHHGLSTQGITTPHDIVNTLIKHHQTKQYYTFLEQEAEKIGKHIQQEIASILPDGTIACYTPNILVDWFYKGFMKGIASNKKPLRLFTFNTAFAPHITWFDQQKIQAHHSSVLLLSKLKGVSDFSWISNILHNHDGIWLNRFSRMVEPQEANTWMGVEQTSMNDADKQAFIQALVNN